MPDSHTYISLQHQHVHWRYFAVGQHLSRTTNAKEAVPWLEEVKRRLRNQTPGPLAVDKAEVLLLLAETYIKSKHYAEALPILDRALKHNIADAVLLRRREEVQQLITKEPSTVLDNGEPKDNSKVAILKWGCRGFSREQSPKALHCCYNFTTTPFLRLAPLKMELLGEHPYVVVYHDVLSDSEIAGILEMAERRMAESDFLADPHSFGRLAEALQQHPDASDRSASEGHEWPPVGGIGADAGHQLRHRGALRAPQGLVHATLGSDGQSHG
ncbi:prolyl 4-hydroxylase subunit alpha-1-like [Drosophila miranda]|uniref:prolyl 4-hydroxylase subunit alpha-1-like n=1 Tax=Drosophila miranda TaxID=7229 RepID=UPI0007E6EE7C|nr:prolyl 4-hydroxylase subunit alpha-1-like [Drosophila miranda]